MFREFRGKKMDELRKTRTLVGHTKRVMKAVENAVISLDDSESFVEYLLELGRRHKMKEAKPSPRNVS